MKEKNECIHINDEIIQLQLPKIAEVKVSA